MAPTHKDMREEGAWGQAVDLHPTLREVVQAAGLDGKKLSVGVKAVREHPDLSARDEIIICSGTKTAVWRVPSMRALFRGDRLPPAMGDEPPPAYLPLFYFIEKHVLTFCDEFGNQTDALLEDAFSNLRRRPDGKSLGSLHFFLWQVAAGLVGIRPVSAAEFEAIIGRLALSASHFRMGPSSRNYVTTLRSTVL